MWQQNTKQCWMVTGNHLGRQMKCNVQAVMPHCVGTVWRLRNLNDNGTTYRAAHNKQCVPTQLSQSTPGKQFQNQHVTHTSEHMKFLSSQVAKSLSIIQIPLERRAQHHLFFALGALAHRRNWPSWLTAPNLHWQALTVPLKEKTCMAAAQQTAMDALSDSTDLHGCMSTMCMGNNKHSSSHNWCNVCSSMAT